MFCLNLCQVFLFFFEKFFLKKKVLLLGGYLTKENGLFKKFSSKKRFRSVLLRYGQRISNWGRTANPESMC